MIARLREARVWLPLVGTAALVWAGVTGTEVGPEAQQTVVDSIVNFVTSGEGLVAAIFAALGLERANRDAG